MKQNVILFSILVIGAVYLWYGTEENSTSFEETELEVEIKPSEAEKLKTSSYHSRKLLFYPSTDTEPEVIGVSSTSIDEIGNSSLETQSAKIPSSFGVIRKKSTGRRKRRVSNSKEQIAWKFNLNVTRYENGTPLNKIKYPTESNDAYGKSEKDKYLGMSMSVSGNGPDQSLEELYQAWESVGHFLRSLFGGNLEELKDKGHGVSVDIDLLPNGTKDMPVDFFMEGSGDDDTQEDRKREGKFLLGLLGFGGNKENPPRDEGSGEPLEMHNFNGTEVLLEIQSENSTQDNSSVSAIAATETPDSKASATSSSSLEETPLTFSLATNDSTPSIPNYEFSEVNCTDCVIEMENISTGVNNEESSSAVAVLNTTVVEFPFNAEALADFCNALFTRLHKSPQSMERSVGNEGSGSFDIDGSGVAINTQTSNILTDEPRPQNLGFFEAIWNRIMGRRSQPVQQVMKESRGARFINIGDLFGEFGSGRSSESGVSSNFEFDNFQAGVTEFDDNNEHFLSDCEEFFKSVQTDTRPNIFDLIDRHPEEVITTEFSTLKSGKSQLNEDKTAENVTVVELDFESTSQSEISTGMPLISQTDQSKAAGDEFLSKPFSEIQFTTETQEKRTLKENEDEISLESSTKQDEVFTEVQEKVQNASLNVHNLMAETTNANLEFQSTETSNFSFFTDGINDELSTEALNVTQLDEHRSFKLFGFGGSGVEASDEGSGDVSDTKERSFGFFNFGSGEREIKENDASTEMTSETSRERSFFSNFGSGGRELNIFNASGWEFEEDSTEMTSETSRERSFFSNFGSGGRELNIFNASGWEFEEDSNSTTNSKGRFFGFGSGERELKETLETTTGKSDTHSVLFLPEEPVVETHNPLSEESPLDEASKRVNVNLKATQTPDESSETSAVTRNLSEGSITIECDDCLRNLNDSDPFIVSDTTATIQMSEGSENRICLDCEVTAQEDILAPVSHFGRMTPTSIPFIEGENMDKERRFESTTFMVDPLLSNRKNQENDATTREPFETTMAKNDPRLIGTIFLTGSGEGGLFVDNNGPINLVQESEFTSPVFEKPPQSGRRGARKHDPVPIEMNFEVTEPVQFTTARSVVITSINNLRASTDEALDETTMVLETKEENVTPIPMTIEPKFFDETTALTISHVTSESVTELDATTIGVITTTSEKITPRTKVLELPKRICSSASECNRTLNERCISTGTTATCNCGRSYVRSPETGKCESPVVLKTSLRLPGEVFHQDLKNRNSERFQKKRNDSIETMMLLLGDDPDLFRTVAGVDVSGFESGSLVVHWEITLAPNHTSTIPDLIEQVDADLKEAFEDQALVGRAPLNVTDAVLMAVTSDMDPCEKTERNYCSKHADCIPDPFRGFVCRCKDDYMDKSMDIGHPGEVCMESCPPYYCGDHGRCSIKEDGNRHCSCNNWFFGERCEISGIIVIAGFASFNVVLIIVVVFMVCVCRRRRRSRQSRFYGQNQVGFQPELGRFTASPSRLADTIAMDEVGPTTVNKYMSISTPLHHAPPSIQIKSPSIMGSSVDYDYESTFDRTPSTGEASVEVHKMEETHQL